MTTSLPVTGSGSSQALTVTGAETAIDAAIAAAVSAEAALRATADSALDGRMDAAETALAGALSIGTSVTTFAATLLDDASAAAMRATLGLGTAATTAATAYATAVQGGKADTAVQPAALTSEADARDLADVVEVWRPGENRALWSSDVSGAPEDRTPLAAGSATQNADGMVLRLTGADADPGTGYIDVAPRRAFAVEPNRVYRVRAAVRRAVDPADPMGHGVELRQRNLSAAKAGVSNVALAGAIALTVADGRVEITALVCRGTPPAGLSVYGISATVRYVTPFLRIYGNGATTDIELIDWADVTEDQTAALDIAALETGAADLAALVDTRLLPLAAGSQMIPVVVAGADVPVWLENGDLAVKGMTGATRDIATSGAIWRNENGGPITPIITAGENVFMWADADTLYCPPFFAAVDAAEKRSGLRASPARAVRAIATDGRSLTRLRAKQAALKAGVAGTRLKVALGLDSWGEKVEIPDALRAVLATNYTVDGGWRSARNTSPNWLNGTYALSGWTVVDGSDATSYTYGAGVDGDLIYTTSTTATATLTALTCTELTIYSRLYGGTWRYRVDGGSWVTVVDAGTSGALKITRITGLTNAAHAVDIATTGNTGTVVLVGYYFSRSAVAGAEVLKIGNGGTTGAQVSLYAPFMGGIVADMAPDVVIAFLGTNDYRIAGNTLETYLAGVAAFRDAWRAAVPDMGFIFCAPAQSDGVAVTPLADLVAGLHGWCIAEGHEFYGMFDDWGAYAAENALAQWGDAVHVNATGAARIARALDRNFDLKG